MQMIVRPGHRLGAVCLIIIGLTGCGGTPRGDVTGKVTYQGRAVVWGRIVLIASDHMPYRGTIGPDGTYTVPKVPCGPVRIGVDSVDPASEAKLTPEAQAELDEFRRKAGVEMPPKPPKGAWFPIPAKYADPVTSSLSGDVTPGEVKQDLNLE